MNAAANTLCKSIAVLACCVLAGCSVLHRPSAANAGARLTPATPATRDLLQLPAPMGKVTAAVYAFRDQTGQYKPAPDSSFSSAVTQGAAALLVKALQDSGWFTTVERENLQDLLTERKIVRALELPSDKAAPVAIPQLMPASIIIEGGIIAYESNVRTGGVGASYLGIGLSSQYRVDQVTVGLRSVDIRTGLIINSVSTTKTIYSYEVRPTVFKFVNFKDMVQFESGMTRNEPAQLCVREAIETAVVHLIVQGLRDHVWALRDEHDLSSPVLKRYLGELDDYEGPAHAARLASLPAPEPARAPAGAAAAAGSARTPTTAAAAPTPASATVAAAPAPAPTAAAAPEPVPAAAANAPAPAPAAAPNAPAPAPAAAATVPAATSAAAAAAPTTVPTTAPAKPPESAASASAPAQAPAAAAPSDDGAGAARQAPAEPPRESESRGARTAPS